MSGSVDPSISSTSPSLLLRVKGRDQEAWRRLMRLYSPLVLYWAERAGLQHADAADVAQHVFQAVASGIERFEKDRPGGTFRGWLRTITRSKVADHFRRQRDTALAVGGTDACQRLQDIAEPQVQPDEDAGEADAVRELRLRGLDLIRSDFEPRTWQMFWRVVVGGEAAKDVAADMGVSASAVRLAKSRVLGRLRQELGDLEP